MNVVDTSCWIEFAENSSIGVEVAPIIFDAEHLLVPTIVVYEIFKKLSTQKGTIYAEEFIPAMLDGHVIPLDTSLSIRAASISRTHKLPMADSIIYATPLLHDGVLWTTDQHFDGLPNVRYFDKTWSG